MHLMQSDRQDIALYIIDRCADIGLELTESARKLMISKATGIFCKQGARIMREQIAWEISLLAPVNITRNTDREVTFPKVQSKSASAIIEYLKGIGCELYVDSRGGKSEYWTILPKAYSVSAVKARIEQITR